MPRSEMDRLVRVPARCRGRTETHVVVNRVLDQDGPLRRNAGLERVVAQVGTDSDYEIGRPETGVFQPAERTDQDPRLRVREVRELLRQAGMHVVNQA